MPHRFSVLDLETTGLDPVHDRIVQIAVVTTEMHTSANGAIGWEIVDRWCSYVRLQHWFQPIGARHIHGIRRRDLIRAPRLADTLHELRQRVRGSTVCAHNAAFDGAFLAAAAASCRSDLGFDEMLCTLTLSRQLDPGRTRSHRLGDLCRVYGIPLEQAHDALADAEATAILLGHLLAAHHIDDPVAITVRHRLPEPSGQSA